jgi:uncharacterized protein (DUF1684 family)
MSERNSAESSWLRELEAQRKGKDEYFVTSHDSPLHHQEREFSGLRYFAPNPKYRMNLKLHRYEHPETIIMATSTGTRQRFHKVGFFEFDLDGKKATLNAYKSAEREDDGELFIPFRDGTSGKESYGAARYLDLDDTSDDSYVLDFNYAYNPYCAYSEDYVCPLPPQENWLTQEIRAGERRYQ